LFGRKGITANSGPKEAGQNEQGDAADRTQQKIHKGILETPVAKLGLGLLTPSSTKTCPPHSSSNRWAALTIS
jgi:hypothetical protein